MLMWHRRKMLLLIWDGRCGGRMFGDRFDAILADALRFGCIRSCPMHHRLLPYHWPLFAPWSWSLPLPMPMPLPLPAACMLHAACRPRAARLPIWIGEIFWGVVATWSILPPKLKPRELLIAPERCHPLPLKIGVLNARGGSALEQWIILF